MSATLEKFAQPGDDDLDLDIDGVSITNVVCNGKDVLVRMEGGFGQWINADEDDVREVDNVTEVEMTMCFPVASDDFIEKLVSRFDGWRARNVPMRICAAARSDDFADRGRATLAASAAQLASSRG